MKTNILLFVLVIFIISLIITLNIFFQQNYQGEMAEQFNRQQLTIARSVARNIEADMQHIEIETSSLARLLSEGRMAEGELKRFVDNVYSEMREDLDVHIKVLDGAGRPRYSSIGKGVSEADRDLARKAGTMSGGRVQVVDLLSSERKVVMLTPVLGPSGSRGALLMEIGIDTINKKFLAPIRAGIRGYSWMMDSNGTLLYHPTQPGMVGKNLYKADASCFGCHKSFDVEKKILDSGDLGFSSYIAPFGEDKLVAFSRARIADKAWIICVSIPYSEVTYSIRKSMKLHSLLAISIFLATLASAFAIVVINRQRVKAEEKAKHLETQRQLEQEVVQARDYLENILESTESKIMVLDRDFTIRTVNSAHERLCGKDKAALVGRSFFDVFPIDRDEDEDTLRAALELCLRGGSHRLSNFAYSKGNRTLYLNISINPLVLHGAIDGIILSSSDVTEEVALKTRLREYAIKLEEMVIERTDELKSEKEKLDAIVGTLEAGLCIVDENRKIVWMNRTLAEWLGEDAAAGISLDRLYQADSIQRSIVNNALLQEVVHQDLGKRKGYFQITSTPLAGPQGGPQALVLIQDITDMKKLEERLMHSEKLSALARISAGVAHEIGNPLTSVSSYVQILREMEHDDFTRESLDTIARHINRIADIVRQMSSFSKTRPSDLRHHNVRSLVSTTLDLVKYDKRMKDVRVETRIPEDLPQVVVDETQLIQVLLNVVLNAADAMSGSGMLEISASGLDREVEIAISDTGPGIPAEHLEKIFDPFFTTKEKGTGLGLAVSYNIVKSYHGDILVENRPGGGTTFRVRLPYYES